MEARRPPKLPQWQRVRYVGAVSQWRVQSGCHSHWCAVVLQGSSSTPATTSTASVPGATLLWHPFAELQTSAATATVQVVAAAVSTAIAGGAQASPCLAILPAAGAGVSSKAADGEAAWHVASRHYMEQAQTVFNLPDGAVLKTVACFVDDQPVVGRCAVFAPRRVPLLTPELLCRWLCCLEIDPCSEVPLLLCLVGHVQA